MELWFRLMPAGLWRSMTFLLGVCVTSWWICVYAVPVDQQQGEVARILFWHAPAAWACLSFYTAATVCALVYVWKRSPHMDLLSEACASVSRFWATLTMITGMLWGQCTWGTYWVWDARLTTLGLLTAMLWILPVLRRWGASQDPQRAALRCAYWTLLGFWNIPLTKMAVEWYNTLHQASTVTLQGSAAAPSTTLLLLLGFALVSVGSALALCLLMRTRILGLRLHNLSA